MTMQVPLKRLIDPARPLTYGIVQAGPHVPQGVPYIRPVDMTLNGGVLTPATLPRTSPEIATAYRRAAIRTGDIVLSIGPSYGKVMVVPPELDGANLTQGTARIAPRQNVSARWLYWSLQSLPVIEYWDAVVAGGTFRALNLGPLAETRLGMPLMSEQQRVTDFLDDQVARIDHLVQARRMQIDLVEHRLESLVFSVLRGERSGQSRKSTIPWLGRTGMEWLEAPAGSQFDIQLGKMLNEERTSGESMRSYLRNTNVQWDRISTDDLKEMNFPSTDRFRYSLRPGDLLICEGGQPGRAAIWTGGGEMYYQKALHRARSRGRSSARWFYYCLRAAVSAKAFAGEGGTTIAHLTGEQLRAARFPFPDPNIQSALCLELDRATSETTAVVAALSEATSLLAERRQALITAAVIGEFDVATASGRGLA